MAEDWHLEEAVKMAPVRDHADCCGASQLEQSTSQEFENAICKCLAACLFSRCRDEPGFDITAVSSFVGTKEEMIYNKALCPAIPNFDTVAYLSDMNIELPCQCRIDKKIPIVWYYKKSANSLKTRMLTSSEKSSLHFESKITIKMNSIIIHKIQVEDSGLYICGSSDGEFLWGYDVDVQDVEGAYVAFQDNHQFRQPYITTKHLTAFTAFLEWEHCDRCDMRGEQRQIGLCYIKSTYLDPRYEVTESGIASCGSGAVPPILQVELADRRPEIYFRSCEIPCYQKENGVIGTIKNWLHSLSKLKGYIPWLPKAPIEKHVHYLGNSLTLTCPGAKGEDAVAWDKDSRRLYKADYLIEQVKTKKMFIDYGNNLNFKSVSFSDQAIYYCWVQGKIKAGIQLVVQADPTENRKLHDADSILAMRYIGISFGIFTLIFIALMNMELGTIHHLP
ncbi:Ig-like V-type domain-containing protein FAM187A [Mantella aurantiaca]